MSADYRVDRTARIARGRLIAIVRGATAEEGEALGEALLAQGLDVLEIALPTPGALRTAAAPRSSSSVAR